MPQFLKLHEDFIRTLYEDIFKVLGIESLEEKERGETLERLARILEERIFTHMMRTLPAAHREKFLTLLGDTEVENEVKFAFIHNHIPNFIDFVEREVVLFKKELAEMKKSF